MKKIIIAVLLTVIYQAYALFGIGGHIGVDNTSVSGQSLTLLSINGTPYDYTLVRDEIKNPLAMGAQLCFDIPVIPIGFELGFEGAWASYKWKGSDSIGGYTIEIPGYDPADSQYNETFDFAKIGVDLTAKWYIFSLPPVVKTVKFYVGGGTGFYFITPVVSDKMIEKELEKRFSGAIDSQMTLDLDEYIEKVTVMGYHFVTGAQIKFPVLPISFNVDYKYVATPENDYGDKTNNFSVIKGSMNLYF